MQSNKIHKVILMSKFIQHLLALHVSDLIGPSSGAFCTSCIRRLCYVVIRVLLDTSSRYKVVGRTAVLHTTLQCVCVCVCVCVSFIPPLLSYTGCSFSEKLSDISKRIGQELRRI